MLSQLGHHPVAILASGGTYKRCSIVKGTWRVLWRHVTKGDIKTSGALSFPLISPACMRQTTFLQCVLPVINHLNILLKTSIADRLETETSESRRQSKPFFPVNWLFSGVWSQEQKANTLVVLILLVITSKIWWRSIKFSWLLTIIQQMPWTPSSKCIPDLSASGKGVGTSHSWWSLLRQRRQEISPQEVLVNENYSLIHTERHRNWGHVATGVKLP